jgi:hypothetical protein
MSAVDTISIVAGGWSVGAIDTKRLPGWVIAVNDAALYSERVDASITMDRLWAENRYHWLVEHLAPKKFFVRRSAIKNLPVKLPKWVSVFDNDNKATELTDASHVFNGTNSGFCAINLAYQLRPKRVILFGFDRSPAGRPYWFPDYAWAKPGGATTGGKYKAWAGQFESAADAFDKVGITVLNASLTSAIETFQKIDPIKVLV